jgi:hypothetical protein
VSQNRGSELPILSGQQNLGDVDHPHRLAYFMDLLDCRRNLDYVRPDRAFGDRGQVVCLQVCGPPIRRLLHGRSLRLEVCLIQRLGVRVISIHNYKCYDFGISIDRKGINK